MKKRNLIILVLISITILCITVLVIKVKSKDRTSISYILRSMALFITGIYFVVALTFLISVFTDSSHKTIGMMTLLFVMTFIFNSLMGMNFTSHMFFPTSYLYPENVLQVKTLTNFSLGVVLNAGLGSILLLISFIRFKNKDFLGAKM